jgi:hypothetical protein
MDEKQEQVDMLRQVLAVHVARLNEGMAMVREAEPVVSALQAAIKAIEQKAAAVTPVAIFTPEGTVKLTSAAAPARKHEYANLTHIESAKLALTKLVRPGETTHVDNIVREIYNPFQDNDLFYRVKRIVVSEIIRAMSKHRTFKRGKKPNTFGLPVIEETKMAS